MRTKTHPSRLEEYAKIIMAATRNVPARFKDDAVQACYLGILKGLAQKAQADNRNGYLYRCAFNEVLTLIGEMSFPCVVKKRVLLEAWKNEKAHTF